MFTLLNDYHSSVFRLVRADISDPSRGRLAKMWVLFYYSMAMFTLPFVFFFATKHFCEDVLHFNMYATNLASVICAVVTVNAIIFFYVRHAMKQHLRAVEQVEREKED